MESLTQPRAEYMLVTPQLAAEWLQRNSRNRKSAKSVVRRYSQAMVDGNWYDTTDAIGFYASDGTLQNGQQRLLAIVETGLAQHMLVMWGLSEDSTNGQDIGRRRNAADLLFLAELPHNRALASSYRYLIMLRKVWEGKMKSFIDSREQPTPTDILELAKQENLSDSFEIGRMVYNEVRLAIPIATALHYETAVVTSYEAATGFFTRLAEGTMLEAHNPIHRLRRQLIRDYMDRKKPKDFGLDVCARVIKVFNFEQVGATSEQLSWRSGGDSPEEFPKIGRISPGAAAQARRRQASRAS